MSGREALSPQTVGASCHALYSNQTFPPKAGISAFRVPVLCCVGAGVGDRGCHELFQQATNCSANDILTGINCRVSCCQVLLAQIKKKTPQKQWERILYCWFYIERYFSKLWPWFIISFGTFPWGQIMS